MAIIRKAGPKIQQRSRQWLEDVDFFGRTGIAPSNLVFVRERRDKADVCCRCAVTHLIDDHVGVLQYLTTVPYRYLFVVGGGKSKDTQQRPRGIRVADSWAELEGRLRRSTSVLRQ